jgi:hypothetical protein
VPTVIRKGTGIMNVPNGSGTPKRPPRPGAEPELLRENISPPTGKPLEETLSDWQPWKAMRRNRTDGPLFYEAPPGALVRIRIGGLPINLMVDTGAEHSVVTQPVGLLSQKHTTSIRAIEDWVCHPFLISRQCNLGSHEVRHEFLYLPDCSMG